MKQFLLFLLIQSSIIAQNINTNSSNDLSDKKIVIEDSSGLSADEVRDVAKESDTYKETKKVSISEVIEAVDEKGQVDVSKLQSPWEELSPTPKKYDWVQSKSGEWFKGEIKAMYDDELEFDSDEIGLYTFDFEDIIQIKSYHMMSTNIEDLASFTGLLRFKDNSLTIIQGDNSFSFQREQIVSFAKGGDLERNYWSGKITLNLDVRSGNKNQFDYTAQGYITRRTSDTRLRLDYLGRTSTIEDIETANDHRLNEKYDVYLTRKFFWTPLFSEFYFDKFQNIESQYTVGVGLGYTIVKTKTVEWDISGGPAYKVTNHYTVADTEDESVSSGSLEISTVVEYELSKTNDIKFNAKMTFTDDANGRYNHHMVLSLENELLSWLDFDITAIWDRTEKPETDADGNIPKLDDFQFLLGLGVEF
jgi:putative salt-induced outer membrane protein YdiY